MPLVLVLGTTFSVVSTAAEAPHVYAIQGARIVPAVGAPIASGTVVLRGGLIAAVGAAVELPDDATAIPGDGLTVYPGLIDMGTHIGLPDLSIGQPEDPDTREELERWKRQVIFQPALEAANHLQPDAEALAALAQGGITSALVVPTGEVMRGQSALVNVSPPPDEPQIGDLATPRGGAVLRTPVAQHIRLTGDTSGNVYPNSLMGVVAFVRQSFLDATHYARVWAHYDRVERGVVRPVYDPQLRALGAAASGVQTVVFEANEVREILRALDLAAELELGTVVIAGGLEAAELAGDLRERGVAVVVSLDYPTRPEALVPDAYEPRRVVRQRENAPAIGAALANAGVRFAFQSDGLDDPRDFLENAGRAVAAGLPADAAVRALTIDAARIAGVENRVGSIEPGKIANVVVTRGGLFDDEREIAHVFIDGRPVALDREDEPEVGDRR